MSRWFGFESPPYVDMTFYFKGSAVWETECEIAVGLNTDGRVVHHFRTRDAVPKEGLRIDHWDCKAVGTDGPWRMQDGIIGTPSKGDHIVLDMLCEQRQPCPNGAACGLNLGERT